MAIKPIADDKTLRSEAERYLSKMDAKVLKLVQSEVDSAKLNHELHVHQIELQLQNEALREAQTELQASEEKYHRLYEFAPVAYVTVNHKAKVLTANLAARSSLQSANNKLVNSCLHHYVAGQDQDNFFLYLRGLFQNIDVVDGDAKKIEIQLLTPEQQAVDVRIEGRVIVGYDGNLSQKQPLCLLAITDIGKSKQQAKQLQEAKALAEAAGLAARNAGEKAIAASDAKSRLLALVSHEIRTPMNGVLAMADLLLRTELSQEQFEYSNTIRGAGERLMVIINDLLDFSRMEAGELRLTEQAFDLRLLVLEIYSLLKGQVNSDKIRFDFNIAAEVPEKLVGDSDRIRQILINLLGNALKFTDDGFVSLTVELVAGGETPRLKFSVSDSGVGIAEERQAVIFEPFNQSCLEDGKKYIGTGLGLLIAKSLVDLHGGELNVSSRLGAGSTFFFEANFRAAKITTDTIKPSDSKFEFPDYSGRKILVVDDNEINRKVMASILGKMHCTMVMADNGEAAVKAWENEEFDLILMDMQMPVMDGVQATRIIREKEARLKHVIIIAVTAAALPDNQTECLTAGMDDYVSKPVSPLKIADAFKYWLR